MNRIEYNKVISNFSKNEIRLKSLMQGDAIYELDLIDPEGNAYFKHQVVSVDLDEMCVHTLDMSQNEKPSKLYSFYTAKETNL